MMDADSPNYAEYVVEKKTEGILRLFRALLILGYVIFGVTYFTVCYLLAFIPLVAVLPVFLWIIVFFTWRYVSYDVGYEFAAGTMTFYRIYARRSKRIRRDCLTVQVREANYAGPWDGKRRNDELRRTTKHYDFASSVASEDAVFLVYRDEKDRECSVRFDCINRVARLLGVFCPNADFTGKKFRY